MEWQRFTVIFDGSCGFCTGVMTQLHAFDWRHRIQSVPFQRPGIVEAAGLTRAQCEQAVWAITPDGRKYRGAGAASAVLDQIVGIPLFYSVYRLPGIHQLEDAAYTWVSEHRSLFPFATPYCERPGADCGA